MSKKRGLIQNLLIVALLVLLEIVSMRMISHSGEVQEIWIGKISQTIQAAVWGNTQQIGRYFSLNKENARLAEENYELTVALDKARQELDDLQTDSIGSTVPRRQGFNYTGARIVKMSRNRQHNYIIIDKGFEDGISQQAGLFTERGFVGVVESVSRNYSYALSFLNPEISVSARIGSDGAVGPLTWDGYSTDGALLKEIPLQYKFNPGDTIYTSGFSSLFPPDIPLGTAGEAKVVNGVVNEIKVKLFQDFSLLRYVTVIENKNLGEILELESGIN